MTWDQVKVITVWNGGDIVPIKVYKKLTYALLIK